MIVLTLIYLVFVAIIAGMLIWHSFKTNNIYEKISAAIMLVLLILRLFLIK